MVPAPTSAVAVGIVAVYSTENVGLQDFSSNILYLNPAPESPRPATPASRSMRLFPKRNSRFFVIPNFSSPLMFSWPPAASIPYSISKTPDCTDSAVVENVGRFGTAAIWSGVSLGLTWEFWLAAPPALSGVCPRDATQPGESKHPTISAGTAGRRA